MATYSFIDTRCSLVGPGGVIDQLGSGAGAAEEGITIERLEDLDTMMQGADGTIMHTLNATRGGRITVRLLKTSPVNAQLSAMANFQKTASANHGANTITVRDVQRGDIHTGTEMAFVRDHPTVGYAKAGSVIEWVFQGRVESILGTGTPASPVR